MIKPGERIQSLIAQEAARLMIEEGIESHHRAKLKAAERLGLQEARRRLPKDEAVDSARQEYLRLFGQDSGARHIETLRLLALEIMDKLETYSPRLVGSVAEGTAGRHSPIVLHVFPETPEDVIKTLIDLRIPYREGCHLAEQRNSRSEFLPALTLNHPRSTIDILMFPKALAGRGAPPRRGMTAQVSRHELRRLLHEANAADLR